jgi:hypothetical protein
MRRLVVFVALAFVYSLQAQSTRLEFEVASIKPPHPRIAAEGSWAAAGVRRRKAVLKEALICSLARV